MVHRPRRRANSDERVLSRFRDGGAWSSSTATGASRPSRIGGDRRPAVRCVSRARAFLPCSPHHAAQHRVGRREDVFVVEASYAPPPAASPCDGTAAFRRRGARASGEVELLVLRDRSGWGTPPCRAWKRTGGCGAPASMPRPRRRGSGWPPGAGSATSVAPSSYVGSGYTQVGDQAAGFGSVDLTALSPALLRPGAPIGGPLDAGRRLPERPLGHCFLRRQRDR